MKKHLLAFVIIIFLTQNTATLAASKIEASSSHVKYERDPADRVNKKMSGRAIAWMQPISAITGISGCFLTIRYSMQIWDVISLYIIPRVVVLYCVPGLFVGLGVGAGIGYTISLTIETFESFLILLLEADATD